MPRVKVLKAPFKTKHDKAIIKPKQEGLEFNITDRDLEELEKRSGGPYVKVLTGKKSTYKRDAKTDKILESMEDVAPGVTSYNEAIKKMGPR